MLSRMCLIDYFMSLSQVYQTVNPGMKTDLRRGLFLLVFLIEYAVKDLFKFILVGSRIWSFPFKI